MDEESIFAAALGKSSPEERRAFLAKACAGDAGLLARVEALLDAHAHPDSFLEPRAVHLLPTADEPSGEAPGTRIGPYKLLEQIGEGGFGVVFMAEQQEPVRRKVALKVLKPGMDTRQVVARFEAERQALALMDHAHIAKVFDGGTTASGRPYFVMELVKGVPVTEFCDRHRLTPKQRLDLFVPVCQAVQHAHQKGIIHRDLKPSNVLVSLHDTTPVVKVIDFGVAKALGQELTDKTLFTGLGQLIGTPLYMSPEQAGLSDLDVDTRSDIYSLGVLLYELLTGTTPFTSERLRQAGYDEMRRIIREEEPPRPSTRMSTLGQAASTVSAQRQSDPRKLSQLFRGELDWIVMKCLEKDRSRRYETANGSSGPRPVAQPAAARSAPAESAGAGGARPATITNLDGWDWTFVAMAHLRLGQVDAARPWLEKLARDREALAKDPAIAWFMRVELEHLSREAEGLFRQAGPSLHPRPDHAPSRAALAHVFYALGRWAEAEVELRKAVRLTARRVVGCWNCPAATPRQRRPNGPPELACCDPAPPTNGIRS